MSSAPGSDQSDGPPYVGALLRLTLARVRGRMSAAMEEAGFHDWPDAQWVIFTYPMPDGDRPADLARRLQMSRQATNHVLNQAEAAGYIERRPDERGRRLVYLSERGRQAVDVVHRCLRQVEEDFAAEVGPERFATTLSVLRELAGAAPQPEEPPAAQ